MKKKNPLLMMAVFLSSIMIHAAQNEPTLFPAIPSQVQLNSEKEVFQLYPYPDVSLIDSYDHIQIPKPSEDQMSHLDAKNRAEETLFSDLVSAPMELRTLKTNANLLERQLNRIKRGVIPASGLNLALALTSVSLISAQDSSGGSVQQHRFDSFFPALLSQKDIFPLKKSNSSNAMTTIDNSYAVAVRFVPKEYSLSQMMLEVLGEYPLTICLVQKGCEELHGSAEYPENPSQLSSLISALRLKNQNPSSDSGTSRSALHRKLTHLDTALAYDLIQGNIEKIEMIYAIPVFKNFPAQGVDSIKKTLLSIKDEYNRAGSKEETFRVGIKFALELTKQGVKDDRILTHLMKKFENSSGVLDLNQPDEIYQFASEKASYLSVLNSEGGAEAWMKKPYFYRYLAVAVTMGNPQ